MNLNNNKKIAIIGLGYVGLPLAIEFGKQRPVLGFDINTARITELQSGQDHTLEASPEELKAAGQLSFSSTPADLKTCQIFIITVPTPVDQANRPDLTPLVKASETVGKALKQGDVVIYESTVYPGATEEVCVPVLEKFKTLSHDLGLTRQEVALGFLKVGFPHAHVIFGAETQDQVKQNALIWKKKMPELLRNKVRTLFSDVSEKILNPVLW